MDVGAEVDVQQGLQLGQVTRGPAPRPKRVGHDVVQNQHVQPAQLPQGLLVDRQRDGHSQQGFLLDRDRHNNGQGLLVGKHRDTHRQHGLLVDRHREKHSQQGLLVDRDRHNSRQGLLVDKHRDTHSQHGLLMSWWTDAEKDTVSKAS